MKRALRQRVRLGLPLTPWDREDILDSDARQAAENRRLRKALRRILEEGSGEGYTEGDIAAAALRPRGGK